MIRCSRAGMNLPLPNRLVSHLYGTAPHGFLPCGPRRANPDWSGDGGRSALRFRNWPCPHGPRLGCRALKSVQIKIP